MVGEKILHYKILSKLGEGGMGVVYKAHDTELDREVAIKFLPREIAASPDERERFKVEAKAAAALNHANIATIHAIEKTDNESFIVMEYINGKELKDKIEAGPLPIDETLDLAIQIAKGLQAAHAKDVVHRDIKSANIMLTDDGDVKIMDFGLAKRGGQDKITKEGTTLGTVAYMSPEQTKGDDVDQRSDIFSLGVLIYEMLAGRVPFKGDYDQAVTYSILNEEPDPVTSLRTGVPMELERIVNKCLKKDPSVRYQHADELTADLSELKKESETREILSKTGVTAVQQEKKRPAYLVPAIIGAAIVVLIAGYLLMSGEPKVTERVPIAVVDFVNETNEPELDGLSGLLITALEQSRHLDVMSRTRMFDELKKMGQESVTFVDEATGREIARHANISALAVATVRKLGETYNIDFKVIDPANGDLLFTANEEGRGQDSIFGMIDNLSQKTRIDLQEQENTVQMASQGIGDVTTTNLEAYHHYFLGEQHMSHLRTIEAEEEYRKAIALDSTFALAYYRLAHAIDWTPGSTPLARKPLEKALAMIDRIPEKEQYLVRALDKKTATGGRGLGYTEAIEVLKEMEQYYPNEKEMLYLIGDNATHAREYETAVEYLDKVLAIDPKYEPAIMHIIMANRYEGKWEETLPFIDSLETLNPEQALYERGEYHSGVRNYEAAIRDFEAVLKADPNDVQTVNRLVTLLHRTRQYDKALEYAGKLLELRKYPPAYSQIARTYELMGDIPKAIATYQTGLKAFPRDIRLKTGLGEAYGYNGEYEKAEAYFRKMAEEGETDRIRRTAGFRLQSVYYYTGQYSKIAALVEERLAKAKSESDTTEVAWNVADKARILFRGYKDRQKVMAAIDEIKELLGDDHEQQLYNLYLALGDGANAQLTYEKFENTSSNRKRWHEIQLHFAQKKWKEAAAGFEEMISQDFFSQAYSSYHAAKCYYEMGNLEKAIASVKAAQGHYGGGSHSTYFPLGFLLLGQIYEKRGDTRSAIQNYKKFLDLWKNADEDLPDLIEAKTRMAKLQGG